MLALLPAACGQERTDRYSAPVAGAILSVDAGSVDQADRLVERTKQVLATHPTWASQMLSEGVEPPTGFFFKYKGRCADRPAVALAVERIVREANAGAMACEDVGR